MANNIINWIIDKYLSNILEINKEKTKTSVLTGAFEMSNLKIKPDIFTLVGIPYFELVHGYVGKIRFKMRMPRFYLHPIYVEVDKIFFHCRQKRLEKINKETELKNMETFKNLRIKRSEEFKNEMSDMQNESEFTKNMISKVINNLDISVSDICIRCDDDISYDIVPFTLGILLKNIKIKSVDKDGNEYVGERAKITLEEINNKIMKLTNLSMYLDTYEREDKVIDFNTKIVDTPNTQVNDEKIKGFLGPWLDYYRYCLSETYEHINNVNSHHYLLYNLGYLVKMQINENLANGKPKVNVNCLLDKIHMSLSVVQIKSLLKLFVYLDLNNKYQLGLSNSVYNKALTDEEKIEYIENYISYYRFMYGKKGKNEKQAKKIKEILAKVECGLVYDDIQIMREAGHLKIDHQDKIEKIDKEIDDVKGNALLRKFRSELKNEQKEKIKELEEKKKKLIEINIEEKMKEALKKVNLNQEIEIKYLAEISDDVCLMKVSITLPECRFDINREQNEIMLSSILKDFEISGDIKKKNQQLSVFIGDICVKQYQIKNTKYENLVETIEQKSDLNEMEINNVNTEVAVTDSNIKDIKDNINKENENKNNQNKKVGACYIELENNPSFENSNIKIKFRNQKRFIITANLYSMQYIASKLIDVVEIIRIIYNDNSYSENFTSSADIREIIKKGFDVDYYIVSFQHKNADMDVLFKSPMILFPFDITDNENKNYILIKCGNFKMFSILPPRQEKGVDYALVRDRSKLFDIFIMKAENISLMTTNNFNGDLTRLSEVKGLSLVEDISLSMVVDLLFEPYNNFFEKLKLSVKIGRIKCVLRDLQVGLFIELIGKMAKLFKMVSLDLENKNFYELKEAKSKAKKKENKLLAQIEEERIKNEELKQKEIKELKEKEEKELKEKELKEKDDLEKGMKEKEPNEENKEENGDNKEENKDEKKEENKEENKKENKEENKEEKKENEWEVIEDKDKIKTVEKNEEGLKKMESLKKIPEFSKNKKGEEDPKLVIVNFTIENIEFTLRKTIPLKERKILAESELDSSFDKEYRDFIVFDLNLLKLDALLLQSLSLKASTSILSMGIQDQETFITSKENPLGELYINEEFQNIIQMSSSESKFIEVRDSRFSSYSESYLNTSGNAPNAIGDMGHYFVDSRQSSVINGEENLSDDDNDDRNNKKEKENGGKEFMNLDINFDAKKSLANVDMSMKKIRVCLSMNTLCRLYQFGFYYFNIFNKTFEETLLLLGKMEKMYKKKKSIRKRKSSRSKSSKSNSNLLNGLLGNGTHLEISNTLSSDIPEEEYEYEDELYEDDLLDDNEGGDESQKKIITEQFAKNLSVDVKNNNNSSNNINNEENNVISTDINTGKNIEIMNINNKGVKEEHEEKEEEDNNNNKDKNELEKEKEKTISKIVKNLKKQIHARIKFDMEETSVLLPLDDTKSDTKVLRLKYNLKGTGSLDQSLDIGLDRSSKIINIDFNSNEIQAALKCFNLEFGVMSYRNGIYSLENICDKMIEGFRFGLNVNSFLLLPEEEKSVTIIENNFEPLSFNIGFRQTKALLEFMMGLLHAFIQMNKEYQDPIKEIEENKMNDDEDNLNINDNMNIDNDNNNINNDKNVINVNNGEEEINTNAIRKRSVIEEEMERIKAKEKRIIERYKRKQERELRRQAKLRKLELAKDKPTKNIDNLNHIIDAKINMDTISIKFYDDTGGYLIPLINVEMSKILIKLLLNTNSDSVENISNLLYESVSQREVPLEQYDLKKLFLYVDLGFNTSINFYNNNNNIWEPVIERYSGTVKVDQVAPFSRIRVSYISNDLLNMNISISTMVVVNDIIKKILQSEEEWDRDLKKASYVVQDTDEQIAVEFVNRTGIDIICWLDAEEAALRYKSGKSAEKNVKFILEGGGASQGKIKRKSKKKIKRYNLNSIYRILPETQIKIKKDKFSFQVQGFMPVYSNDYSSNYTTCLKIKKEISIEEKLQKENENNNININKNNNNNERNKIVEKQNDDTSYDYMDDPMKEKLLSQDSQEIEAQIIKTDIKDKQGNSDDNHYNNDNDDDYVPEDIEIVIKIRKTGSLKTIVFESNIFFFNNLQVPISLSLISQNDFVLKYSGTENKVEHIDNKNKYLINSGSRIPLSVIYLLHKYRVYVSFYNEIDETSDNYSLLYEDFNCLKNNYNDLLKYLEENSLKNKSRKITELKDDYSKLISLKPLSNENKEFYISSNLFIQRGTNDNYKNFVSYQNQNITQNLSENVPKKNKAIQENNEIDTILKKYEEEENIDSNETRVSMIKENYYTKTFIYLFILNEPLVLENQLPFNIKCVITNSKIDKEKNIYIRPLQNKYLLDVKQEDTTFKLVMKYHDKNFLSELIDMSALNEIASSLNDKKKNKNKKEENDDIQIKLFEENSEDKSNYIECNIKTEENINSEKLESAYEKEYVRNIKAFQNKKKLIFYCKCLIMNKTDNILYIKNSDSKIREPSLDNPNGKIFANSVSILNTKDIKKSFQLRTAESSWSEKFNINTIGSTGVTSLEVKEGGEGGRIRNLDVGVSISSSWSFLYSLLITIEPRFLLINKLGYDIEYKQYNNKKEKRINDNDPLFETHLLKNGEEIKLNLLKGTKGMKKMIQIKMGENSEQDEYFSCPFDLDEVGNVDIKVPISEKIKDKIMIRNHEIEKEIRRLRRKEKNKENNDINTKKEEEKNLNNNGIMGEKFENNENDINNEINNETNNENNNENADNTNNNNTAYDEDDEEISNININLLKLEKQRKLKEEKELTPEEERKRKLEEKNKKIEEMKTPPRKYNLFTQNGKSYLLINVIKQVYKGLIYIIIYPPKFPKYIIKNETSQSICLKQKKDNFYKETIELNKDESIPYVWGDPLKNDKKLLVVIDKNEIPINLNEIKVIRKELKIENKSGDNPNKNKKQKTIFFFQTVVENNQTRKLIIKNEDKSNVRKSLLYQRSKKEKKKTINIRARVDAKGFGLSIINRDLKEIFYMSFYGCLLEVHAFTFYKDESNHLISNVKVTLKNFQFDYCLDDHFKSMIIPLNPVTPQTEMSYIQKNELPPLVPLFQGIITFHRATNPLTQVSSNEFPQLDFTIQPVKVNISQYQLMSLLELALDIKPEIDFYLVNPEKSKNQNKKYKNISALEKSLFEDNSNNNDYLEYDPDHYDSKLDISILVSPEEIIFNSEKNWMIFIKNIAIGGMKVILSTRIDIGSFGNVLPGFLMGILSAVGNILTHITDYHLNFASLYYEDVFTDIFSLVNQLINEYVNQVKRKIFQIIGSMDILGNPTGYVSAIGQGFIQLYEAPRRGLINGPLGFGEGIAKGFGIFISTIISSTFDVVGKISGTLLASCEELQGNKGLEFYEDREPDNLFEGIYMGVRDGILDLGKGIGGIFYKPFQGAKKSGIGGFFKGIGSGIIGAAVSPLTAGFRIVNNLFVGIKNTANMFNPQLKTERFRYPRAIQKAIGLSSYNEDLATVKAILDFLGDYDGHEIIYFKQFIYMKPGLDKSMSTLILTNKCVLVVYEAKEVVFEIDLDLINNVEVHKEPNQIYFDLIFYLNNKKKRFIRTNDINLCEDFYLMLAKTKD